MSDKMKVGATPRTDAAYKAYQGLVRANIAIGPLLELSRQLERENDALVSALQELVNSCTTGTMSAAGEHMGVPERRLNKPEPHYRQRG